MSMPVKHDFGKIGEDLVTFVEREVNAQRMNFLKDLLEYNGFEVIIEEHEPAEEGGEKSYNVAVNDLVFNPVIWVYDRKLRTPDGHIVNEDYWMQRNTNFRPQYWER